MDPALCELLTEDIQDEVKAIMRLRNVDVVPAGVRVVAQFGDIVTCRLNRQTIPEVWANEDVCSLKAPRYLIPEPTPDVTEDVPDEMETLLTYYDERRPPNLPETGQGVVVGVADWGIDFAHPDFLNPDGTTRLLALWDQRGDTSASATSTSRYGYGTIHTAETINWALQQADPYQALGYHPDDSSHGTHVAGIALGNGQAGGPLGIAPQADLVFVHLSTGDTGGLANLGDSVTLLEAMDFITQMAGERPCVINTSVGRHGGPHDGSTLVEQGFDALISERPGRAIVQSTGNYFDRGIHAADQLRPGDERTLNWLIDAADQTPNELEVWYSGRDTFGVEVHTPDDRIVARVPLGEQLSLKIDQGEVGRIYHRAFDPNNQHHHINIFLDPTAPAGQWQVILIGEDIVDGRFHAWVERDAGCIHCQSFFEQVDDDRSSTTGTICNGFRTIAVGAYNGHSSERELAPFSSAGPTRDGRQKPDCVAPGVQISAPRSAARQEIGDRLWYVRKSGTSMAAPHVTGTIACMFEAAARPLTIQETRNALLSSTTPVMASAGELARLGSGYLNIETAVETARYVGGGDKSLTMSDDENVFATAEPMLTNPVDRVDKQINRLTERLTVPHPNHQPELAKGVSMSSIEMISQVEETINENAALNEILPESRTRNFILISGGPGLYDDRDVEHDKSWANYVTPPLLLTDTKAKRKRFSEADEDIWWFVYKPAYIDRWADDVKNKRKSVQAVKDRGFTSYVNMIEERAKARGWQLRWLNSADGLWPKLKSFKDPISRVWYWGHARDSLWLTLAHSTSSQAVAPNADAIIAVSDITTNASLASRFQAGSSTRMHRFIGCNTDQFAQTWAKTFKVWSEGFKGKVDFSDIHTTGGEPTLVGSASRKRFATGGNEESIEGHEMDPTEDSDQPPLDTVNNFDDPVKRDTDFTEMPVNVDIEEAETITFNVDIEAVETIADDFMIDLDSPFDFTPSPFNHDSGAYLVEAMSEAIDSQFASQTTSAQLLQHLLGETSDLPGAGQFLAPATMFDAALGCLPGLADYIGSRFEVVAYPGEPLPDYFAPGDLLLRRGEGNLGHLAMLTDGAGLWADELAEARLPSEVAGPGLYIQVIEAGASPHRLEDQFSRRVSRDGRRLDHDNLILRLRSEATDLATHMFGESLDIARAVPQNERWANRLGWAAHIDAIVRLLHNEPFTPDPEAFARLVYAWQQQQGLSADGIIGPRTWQRMQTLIGISPTPAPTPVPPRPGSGGAPTMALGRLQIVTPTQYRIDYPFTAADLLWTARFIVGEAGGRDDADNQAVIWAMFNRYAFFTHRVFSSFQQFIRRYSTPLQPVLNSSGAARRHMHRPEFVRTGGFYPGTTIPRGQLERHLRLQRTPWNQLPAAARALAERALQGRVSNPIGVASEFASTRIYFHDQNGRWPTPAEWRRFTENYTRGGRWRWVGDVAGLDQMGKNAFFIDRRVDSLPANTAQVVTALPTPVAPRSPATHGGQISEDSEAVVGPCPDLPVPPGSRPVILSKPRRSVHAAVREAQRKLNAFHAYRLAAGLPGLRDAPLTEDCIFGTHTFEAVKSFQELVFPGMPAEHDGKIGSRTWAQLDAIAVGPGPVLAAQLTVERLRLMNDTFTIALSWDQIIGLDTSTLNLEMAASGLPPATMPAKIQVQISSRVPNRASGVTTLSSPVTIEVARFGPDSTNPNRIIYRTSQALADLGDFFKVERQLKEVATIVRRGGTSDVEFRNALGWNLRGKATQPVAIGTTTGSESSETPDAFALFQAAGVEVLEVQVPARPNWRLPSAAKRLVRSPADVVYYSGHGLSSSGKLAIDTEDKPCGQTGRYSNWLGPADLIPVWKSPMDLDLLILAGCSVLKIDFSTSPPSGPGLEWAKLLTTKGGPLAALLGYQRAAPCDSPVGDRIARQMGERMAAGSTSFARDWLEINGNNNANNAVAMDSRGYWWIEGTLFGGFDIKGPKAIP